MDQKPRRIRVVIADDSRTALYSVCKFLEFSGQFEIVGTAFDGVLLLRLVERFKPELVLADVSMPRMNGFEAAAKLRKSNPGLRIVMFSGLDGLSLRDECMRSGADAFVAKNNMPEMLLQEIVRLFPDAARVE